MAIYKFRDKLCRTTIATDNGPARVAFFVYFGQDVEPSRCGVGHNQVFGNLLVDFLIFLSVSSMFLVNLFLWSELSRSL